jgi:anaerobic ribonucleoside-triphosphate reductase activating protein
MNQAAPLRLHHFEPVSQVNGPGKRCVIWVQGCSLACPGCFNPETHSIQVGQALPLDQLLKLVLQHSSNVEGITISGGEPLQQAASLSVFLDLIKAQTSLSVVLFSGFSWPEIQRLPEAPGILKNVDILLAGRYQSQNRVARSLLGSANKTIHFLTSRYSQADLQHIPESEVILAPDGSISISGIDPLRL